MVTPDLPAICKRIGDLRLTSDGFLALFGTFISVIAVTYLISAFQGAITVRYQRHGSRPPKLPYATPLLGHLPEFLKDNMKFLARATAKYGPSTPVRIQLLNRRMSLLKGAESITTLFKSSRNLSSEHWLVQVLVNAFGVEVADAPFYLADDTGIGNQPDPRSKMTNPEHRIFHLVFKSVHSGLSGASLEEMERQLVRNLSSQIHQTDIQSDSWVEVSDLYGSLIRNVAFRASVVSLCGLHVFETIPNFDDDFWAFDSALPNLFKEIPRWLAPASYAARDKMKEHLEKWQSFAHEHYDVRQGQLDKREWEEFFGSRLMRTRHEFFQKMPLSKETVAADDLGLVWATTANTVPAIGWMLLEVLQRPDLLLRVREEIAPFVCWDPSDPSRTVVDISNLCCQPLLQSIYAEVLRLHSGTVINRVPTTSDFHIGGWHFKEGEQIIVSTYNTARDQSVWNQGNIDDPHPVNEFWPERFILYPDNPNSGPVLRTIAQQQEKKSQASTISEPTFSLDGTAGSWIPYGGGTRMCPGRHFSKKAMIVTMAMFLTAFEIELLIDEEPRIQPDLKYFMFGVMHPDGKIPARIRKRVSK
ncbi:hypothetical protein N7474_008205 [Penicillium riverlandense]|uniref:uncharacterized protein n=1 Tax=Penicillium riverlandense TaxID=1903569 RepID=UPI0025473B84|nr:uncharacterized protein N7474_008205 [Penicillium riverlandense]KAJ5811904.1 hypothetical protein N7474_008205 [Penicillium riverlandense]